MGIAAYAAYARALLLPKAPLRYIMFILLFIIIIILMLCVKIKLTSCLEKTEAEAIIT